MSRRQRRVADSLDLLLDTICNTFGGVLFIAMLVMILANLSGTIIRFRPGWKTQEPDGPRERFDR